MNPEGTMIIQFDPGGFGLVIAGSWQREEPGSGDVRFNLALPIGLGV
jgi:hypothetical protein